MKALPTHLDGVIPMKDILIGLAYIALILSPAIAASVQQGYFTKNKH
jgi:hypothetical protein